MRRKYSKLPIWAYQIIHEVNAARINQEMSIREMARRMNGTFASPSTLSRIFAGHRVNLTVQLLERMMEAVGIEITQRLLTSSKDDN